MLVKSERELVYSIARFLYDMFSEEKATEDLEQKIEESYDVLFTQLENKYENADRNDNELFNAISDFSEVHEKMYFETGILMGFQLYKGLEEAYKNRYVRKKSSVFDKSREKSKNGETQSILEQFSNMQIDNALESRLKKDKGYQKISKEIADDLKKIDEMGLNAVQWKTLDNILSKYNYRSAEYGREAYIQGFVDAVTFGEEIRDLSFGGIRKSSEVKEQGEADTP